MSRADTGSRGAGHHARPLRVLLAVNRPRLERLMEQCTDCRIVACVRDVEDLRRHLRPSCAEVLVLAQGFCPDGGRDVLPALPAQWALLRVAAGPRCAVPATVADPLDAWLLAHRLRRRARMRGGPAASPGAEVS